MPFCYKVKYETSRNKIADSTRKGYDLFHSKDNLQRLRMASWNFRHICLPSLFKVFSPSMYASPLRYIKKHATCDIIAYPTAILGWLSVAKSKSKICENKKITCILVSYIKRMEY